MVVIRVLVAMTTDGSGKLDSIIGREIYLPKRFAK